MAVKKEHLVFSALALLFIAVLSYEAFYNVPSPHEDMMAHHDEMHGFMAGRIGPSLLGFNILFWILILALAYLLISDRKAEKGSDDAIALLRERYAKGEIDRDEYLEKFKDIKEG